ncbi:EscU/YscU/HrcU family type III secretion system export apparatus switch protein [Aliidiomarina sanyensis]|uniref:Flagellar protein FhlB n=1 Tax=Aliidiomarina sanyensis TaxID=1249555 RepID=A0A432WPY7_9GAMM|nr:EscU/YscU/HrcU family type III secretion system export apparatus switch protein [Aliidiomarina sanyensis]RUO35808.1 flagellar protein FhlB [Aliidiomarina sanyensis]
MTDSAWEKRRGAVAIGYDETGKSAQVLAQGYGEFAERILQEAKKHGIYVHDAPELVGLLMQLNPSDYLPDDLRDILVELLLWLNDVAKHDHLGSNALDAQKASKN